MNSINCEMAALFTDSEPEEDEGDGDGEGNDDEEA
jgi:hypothetical protein